MSVAPTIAEEDDWDLESSSGQGLSKEKPCAVNINWNAVAIGAGFLFGIVVAILLSLRGNGTETHASPKTNALRPSTLPPTATPTLSSSSMAPANFSVVSLQLYETTTGDVITQYSNITQDTDLSLGLLDSSPLYHYTLRAQVDDPAVDQVFFLWETDFLNTHV